MDSPRLNTIPLKQAAVETKNLAITAIAGPFGNFARHGGVQHFEVAVATPCFRKASQLSRWLRSNSKINGRLPCEEFSHSCSLPWCGRFRVARNNSNVQCR